MDTVRIGKTGQIAMTRGVLEAAGVEAGSQVIIESEPDGSTRLRPVGIDPFDIYSNEQSAEFETREMKQIAEDFHEAEGYTGHWNDLPPNRPGFRDGARRNSRPGR